MRCEDSRYFFLLTFALVIITQEFGVGVGVSVCGAFFFCCLFGVRDIVLVRSTYKNFCSAGKERTLSTLCLLFASEQREIEFFLKLQ